MSLDDGGNCKSPKKDQEKNNLPNEDQDDYKSLEDGDNDNKENCNRSVSDDQEYSHSPEGGLGSCERDEVPQESSPRSQDVQENCDSSNEPGWSCCFCSICGDY